MSGAGGHAEEQKTRPPRGARTPLAAVLTANTISTAGSSLTLIGVPWFVLETTGSAGRAGVVAFCATLPIVVAALIGGPVIDRLGRRRVSVGSDLVCALAVGAIPLLHFSGALHFWLLCALMALEGLAATPGRTARYVLVPDLAERAGTTLARAASLFDAVQRGARMAGAALAGLLIALVGAESVLLLDAATFATSALLVALGVRGIRAAEPVRDAAPVSLTTYRAELREAYAFLLHARLLLAVSVMVMVTNGLDQGWNAVLLPVHAERELGGATQLGLLTASFGAGGLLGALLYGAVGHRFPRRAVFTTAFVLAGAPRFVVAALTGSALPLAATMALGGLAGGMLNPILTTVTYERVPQELRSRVSGALTAGCELAMPLGGLGAGLLVDAAGPRGALLTVGAVYLATTLSPLVFPTWRTMDAAGLPPSGLGEDDCGTRRPDKGRGAVSICGSARAGASNPHPPAAESHRTSSGAPSSSGRPRPCPAPSAPTPRPTAW